MSLIKVEIWVKDGSGGVDIEHSNDIQLTEEDRDQIGDIISQSEVFDLLYGFLYRDESED